MRPWLRAVAVIAGVALVAGIGFLAFRSTLEPAAMTGVIVAPGNVGLSVADQTSPAGVVVVDRVLAPGPSWVVVSSLPTADRPGGVIGFAAVPAGESRDVTVTLLTKGVATAKLAVTLHADRGVPGQFEFEQANYDASPDKPYFALGTEVSKTLVKDTAILTIAEAAGASVSSEVSAAAGSAALEVGNRLTVIDTLVVDRVVAPGPSWLAAYLVDDTGRPSGIVGWTHVDAGETMNVEIPMTPSVTLTDKLLVAVQADAGEPGHLDFTVRGFAASPDKPYAVGGAELSSPVLLRGYGMDYNNTAGSGSGM